MRSNVSHDRKSSIYWVTFQCCFEVRLVQFAKCFVNSRPHDQDKGWSPIQYYFLTILFTDILYFT